MGMLIDKPFNRYKVSRGKNTMKASEYIRRLREFRLLSLQKYDITVSFANLYLQ